MGRDEGIGFEAFRVGFDGISVVTRAGTALGEDCLTFPELRRVWIEGSPVEDWAQIGPGFASLPLTLSGPGVDSGTYDFFNEEVLGTNAAGEANRPRTDVTTSEDDEVIVNEVLARPGVMGYFGYSYYEENRDRLRVLALNDGRGCLFPSPETIASGTYPLARPLFIYVSTESLKRPEVADFVRFYLTNGQELAEEADIVPVPRQVLDQGLNRLADLVEEASQQ
jgi:phosphate transport system substrate-binding protein